MYSYMCFCAVYRRIRQRIGQKSDPTKSLFVICPKEREDQCKNSFALANQFLHPGLLPKGMYERMYIK